MRPDTTDATDIGDPDSTFVLNDPTWGRLTIDREALLDALGVMGEAGSAAHRAAQWKRDDGYAINSAWADALFGINSTIDALMDLLQSSDGTQSETTR